MAEGLSSRTEILIGKDGVERLRESSVVLCGCGAVGGYAFEGLVRAGVGRIRVVDRDVFSESNLNRQVLATLDTIGMRKTEAARLRALSINPDVDVETMDVLVSEETVPEILDGGFDVLIDAIDTVRMKVCLLRAACDARIRTFSSMGAARHLDAGAVRIAPVMKSKVCPVASAVRSGLRGFDASLITCVYSEEKPIEAHEGRDEHGKSVLGSMPTIPAIFGMTLANEAVRHLLADKGGRTAPRRQACLMPVAFDMSESVVHRSSRESPCMSSWPVTRANVRSSDIKAPRKFATLADPASTSRRSSSSGS